VSYDPKVFYEPLNDKFAHLVLFADCDPNSRNELGEAFGQFFEELNDISDIELKATVQQYIDHTTGSMAPLIDDRKFAEAHYAAINFLLGNKFESSEELEDRILSLTLADIKEFVHELQKTIIFALPGNVKLQHWMGQPATMLNSEQMVQGRNARYIDEQIHRLRLYYSRDGVRLCYPDGGYLNLLYSDLAAALHFDDGCMSLIGPDSRFIILEPTLWHKGQQICQEIYNNIPKHLILEQGSRPSEAIPKPKTTRWQRVIHTLRGR
jgi:hypothetical protein